MLSWLTLWVSALTVLVICTTLGNADLGEDGTIEPKVFIGSSAEAVSIAHSIQENLDLGTGTFSTKGTCPQSHLSFLSHMDQAVAPASPPELVLVPSTPQRTAREVDSSPTL